MAKKKIIIFCCCYCVCCLVAFIAIMLTSRYMPIEREITINCIDEHGKILYSEICKTTGFNSKITFEPKEIVGYEYNYDNATSNEVTVDSRNYDAVLDYKIKALNMPIIKIDTDGNEINSKEDYTEARISVLNCDEEYIKSDVSAGIRLRGNSTLQTQKPPYRIKFDAKTNFLGLNNNSQFKNWVLLAEYFDYSLSRNFTSFLIGNELNIYCSDYKFVEVYVNGNYTGVYLLCEQQQINNNRIDIEEYKEGVSDSLDTGYLLENDYYYYDSEDYVIETNIDGTVNDYNHWIVKSDTTKEAQLEYITAVMQNVNDAIFTDKSEAAIRAVVNIDSAVEMTILQLINKDPDVNSSFFISKDAGNPRINFVAPWDDDMAYGNHNVSGLSNGVRFNHLLDKLMKSGWFFELVKDRWQDLTASGLQEKIISNLDYIMNTYEQEFDRNFKVYEVFGTKSFVDLVDDVLEFTSQKDACLFLQDWLNHRFEWLNSEYFDI